MNKTAIKNFAIWARTRLIEDIKYKASLLGITEKGIANPLPQSTSAEQYYDIGTKEPNVIIGKQITQRRSLAEAINNKAKEVDYKVAYNSIMEAVAYTWFNRLIAVRFMEVNDYLPCKIRVLSAEDGRQEPDIVRMPMDARLDYSDAEVNLIRNYQLNNASDELFQMLFIKVCNDLSSVLPQLFEKQDDYTELLLNISYTNQDGLVYKLVHDIPQEDFDVEQGGQIEIIGWLYQYYNTEPKNETFALLKKNVKITKERIPSATQLFTPDWIVRYMVENSLGRLWVEGHPNDFLKNNWKYYLEEAEQEADVKAQLDEIRKEYAKLNPEDIKVIDPCMGSGHILVYAFDVLMQIYLSVGYSEKDAVISILENNLYGLDIDERAFQLAYFAVLMKARQYHKFIFKKQVQHHIHTIVESNGIKISQLQYFGAGLDELSKNAALPQIQGLIDQLKDAKEYGSILTIDNFDWNLLRQFVAEFDITQEPDLFATFGIEATQQRLQQLIDVGESLAQKYEVVVTNPPYMGASNLNTKVNELLKNKYPDSKADLFSVFIERCGEFVCRFGFQAMITQHAWMFISSFEKLRAKIICKDIVNMAHLGARAFEEIVGEVVQTTSFVLRNSFIRKLKGKYCRLIDADSQNAKEKMFLAAENRFEQSKENFSKIPGEPVAYWANEKVCSAFVKGIPLADLSTVRNGMKTGNNEKFLRLWWEINDNNICYNANNYEQAVSSNKKWFPYNKGGSFRKWYGNNDYVVNWENAGNEIFNNAKSDGRNVQDYPHGMKFTPSGTWSLIATDKPAFRYKKCNLSDIAGMSFYLAGRYTRKFLGFCNSIVACDILRLVAPTINYQAGDIGRLPILDSIQHNEVIERKVDECIEKSTLDWDSFEISWDYEKHPLVPTQREWEEQRKSQFANTRVEKFSQLEWHYRNWENDCEERFNSLKANEEELNRIFIDIYGLQDELTPEVEDKDVTVRKADLQRDVKSLLSYAVGCMFGRYSLDVEGLAYAGGEWDASKYATFLPDEDNVIPITDEDYFEDDIVGRFVEWLKAVYGDDSLEENLLFIANALGTSGDTPRQCIRNYFLKDFYKDHCKVYQKRPIYWLYDSGKQNGFKALIYMHRYNEDTTGKMRVDYLARMEETYESEINREQNVVDNGVPREAAKAAKRIEKLKKQLKECRDYDVNIGHIALSRIAIDLDDGVKVNYEKVQTGKDGTVLPILAKI